MTGSKLWLVTNLTFGAQPGRVIMAGGGGGGGCGGGGGGGGSGGF